MPRAVRFNRYGDVNVLDVVEVPRPVPARDQVLVEVVTAAINPGEIAIREGAMDEIMPATFPSGQGSDFAGRVAEVGSQVATSRVNSSHGPSFAVGDEVIGWSDTRSAQADFVAVPADHLIAKPSTIGWKQAGSLFVVGVTAFAAVRAVNLRPGDVVAVSGAAGGVGSVAVQLAKHAGATVLGIAGAANLNWLRSVGVEAIERGDGLAERLRAAAPDGIDAFIDTYGGGYVQLAIELGIAADRIDTIIDFEAVNTYGVKGEGSSTASSTEVLSRLADLVAWGELVVPIAATYALEDVRAAYTELARRHTRGKIVLALQ